MILSTVDEVVSTPDGVPPTFTDEDSELTLSRTGTSRFLPTLTLTCLVDWENPPASTRRSYAPGESPGRLKRRCPSVVVCREVPRSVSTSATLACWIAAPDGSDTHPLMEDEAAC